MINSQNLIDKICAEISAGGLTSLETCQVNGALTILNTPVVSVATRSSLPNAVTYNGRLIYVVDESRYYHAVRGYWTNYLASDVYSFASELWAWGSNTCGRLGDGTTVSKRSPVQVLGGFGDWCGVSAGYAHSLGVRTNGTAWAWGCNAAGQIGDGTVTSRSSPVSVVGGFTDWCGVSGARCRSFGIRTNGTIWAWGDNFGRLGDGTTIGRSSPVSVVGGFIDWCGVSTHQSGGHSLGIRTNCSIWAWGSGLGGILGNGATVATCSPVSVVGGFTDWCGISAGNQHSLAIRTDGTIWAWGSNNQGQLGDVTTVSKSSPVSVVGGFTDWCGIAGGVENSLAIRTNGSIWAWGNPTYGRLGDGTTVAKSSPVSVVGGFTDWCGISGSLQSMGIRTNGSIWAWGANDQGQLGDNTITSRSSPVSVVGGFTDWCTISAGNRHSLGIRALRKGF
jgi:alpha-tubulin suppressor-like RCC1 family protein